MSALPSGTVTFLFTDIEGSTRLWEEHPHAMRDALARHDELVRAAIESHGGYVVKTTGDGFHAAFATAESGVASAVAAQRALDGEAWPLPEPLRVRMGLHTGVAAIRDGDYFGSSLNRAARLMGVAHGGQLVCSQATTELARDVLAEGVEFVDLGEHRLRDLSRAERVFQVNAEGLASDFAALTSVDAFPGNLPLQVSSFVGRDQELELTLAALAEARVVTLTGVGGVGKTRLALQVAGEVLPRFREGAWLVELAAVRDPEGVVDAFTTVFGVTARAGQTATEALVEFLGTKQLLLVVDNCEHLLDPVAELVDEVVRACPGVVILATSREGLALPGERILAVPSLRAPGSEADLDTVAASDAVQLFVDRAHALDNEFVLGSDNAEAVVRVCRRLDGVPLAIELAAARVNVMSPAELADGLDHRFDVLAGGRRGAVKRQQTLRATIDWSYDLLSEPQQRLLARLSVFAGGCTREAAEQVCAGDPIEARTVFGLLGDLVDRSLVVADRGGLDTRYRLLETIREYAEERLADAGETEALRARHRRHYADFFVALAPEFLGPEQLEALQRSGAEFENLLVALNDAIDNRNVDEAMRFVRAVPLAGALTTHQVMYPFAAVLELPGADQHPLYPYALAAAAARAGFSGDRTTASRLCDEALDAAARLGAAPDADLDIGIANTRGVIEFSVGRLRAAAAHYEHAAETARADDRPPVVALELAAAAMYYAMLGEADTAISLATDGLAIARSARVPLSTATCLLSLAGALAERDPMQARAYLRESMQLLGHDLSGNWAEVTQAVMTAGRIADWRLTAELAARALPRLHWAGNRPLLGTVLNIASRPLAQTDPDAAAHLQGAARTLMLVDAPPVATSETEGPGADRAHQATFVAQLRRQTTEILREALGDARLRELRTQGEAMSTDDAVAYALAHVDVYLRVTDQPGD